VSLLDDLRTLADSNGAKALADAFHALQGTVRRARRGADRELGALARTLSAALKIWDAQKADGVPLAERQRGLEQSLRAAWPQGRSEPWHYLCERCSDTGWEPRTCTPETPCGRPFRLPGASADDWTGKGRCTPNHAYVVPCWCLKGQGFRRGLEKAPKDPERDFTEAGRAKKLTRLGR
jgi:hypothetical protein